MTFFSLTCRRRIFLLGIPLSMQKRNTEHTVTGRDKPPGQIKTEKKASEYVTFCYLSERKKLF